MGRVWLPLPSPEPGTTIVKKTPSEMQLVSPNCLSLCVFLQISCPPGLRNGEWALPGWPQAERVAQGEGSPGLPGSQARHRVWVGGCSQRAQACSCLGHTRPVRAGATQFLCALLRGQHASACRGCTIGMWELRPKCTEGSEQFL